MAVAFATAAFSHFRDIREEYKKHNGLQKPLLLAISSCYISYPDNIEKILEQEENNSFMIWASALVDVSSSSSEPALSLESEIKLAVVTLAKVIESLLRPPSESSEVLHKCFVSCIEATTHLKEVQEEDGTSDEEVDEDDGVNDEEEEESDYEEDSEDDEYEEIEEEFLDRYAKASAELEDDIVEEGDLEDDTHALDLDK